MNNLANREGIKYLKGFLKYQTEYLTRAITLPQILEATVWHELQKMKEVEEDIATILENEELVKHEF